MEQNTDIYVAFGIEQIEVAKAKCKDPLIKVEHRVNFSRWVPDGFGTADLVIIAGGEIHVCDLKYWSLDSSYQNLRSRNMQLWRMQ